jgi:Holliday junction resolvasome RuvABC endonuclease subunit
MDEVRRILAIDLGTSLGWAHLRFRTGQDGLRIGVVACGVLDCSLKTYESWGMRPWKCEQGLTKLLDEIHPEVVVFEDIKKHQSRHSAGPGRPPIVSNNWDAAHVYGEFRGILLKLCDTNQETPVPATPIQVGAWKKAAVGRGNASKEDVAEWARETFSKAPLEGVPFDVTDAIGIGVGWIKTEAV